MLWHDSCHFELSFICHNHHGEKNDNIQCINYTTKTETVREQVQNMLKQLHFSSRPAFLLSKTACRAAWDPGVRATETWVWERCRPGSVQGLSVDAWMFIRHVGGTFMPCFCILCGEKGRFIFKWPRFVDGYFCIYKHKYHIISYINE